jgi:hypothetical protein
MPKDTITIINTAQIRMGTSRGLDPAQEMTYSTLGINFLFILLINRAFYKKSANLKFKYLAHVA